MWNSGKSYLHNYHSLFGFFKHHFLSTISHSRMFHCPGWSTPDFGHPGQRGATVFPSRQFSFCHLALLFHPFYSLCFVGSASFFIEKSSFSSLLFSVSWDPHHSSLRYPLFHPFYSVYRGIHIVFHQDILFFVPSAPSIVGSALFFIVPPKVNRTVPPLGWHSHN